MKSLVCLGDELVLEPVGSKDPWRFLFTYLLGCIRIYLGLPQQLDFPGGSDGKASAYDAGDLGSIPGLGRSPGEGNGNPLQYYCLENPMDRGAWQATVHGVTKSRTRLRDFTSSLYFMLLRGLEGVFFFFNWWKIALQCCVGLCCTAQISHNYM